MRPFSYLPKSLVASAFLLSMASCAMTSGQESGGQYADDAAITTKVKAAYVNDPQVSAMQIHVETMKGVVQLSGFAQSAKGEAQAVDLARQVEGVRSVKDNIVVNNP
jgi:osmotically-inducible protein OsmY